MYSLPEKKYKTSASLRKKLDHSLPPLPSGFDDSHLTYVTKKENSKRTKFSTLNRLAKKYKFDAYVTLSDLNLFVRDEDFHVPVPFIPYRSV